MDKSRKYKMEIYYKNVKKIQKRTKLLISMIYPKYITLID